jgi:broad specificity phosphatase PhoE
MPDQMIYLARHGETAWSRTGQHTGLTDLPLTERGEQEARELGKRLSALTFAKVFTSPSQRAARSCDLAGFGKAAETDADLVEWNYGKYEGRKSAEIHLEAPNWQLFRDGCPGGETPAQIGAPSMEPCWFFPADIFCGCSPRAFWASSPPAANISS